MSDHGATFCVSRNSASAQVNFAFEFERRFDSIQHLADAELLRRSGRVVDSGLAVLHHPDGPFRQIARIDELHRIVRIARREHFAAAIDPHRPVGEAVGLVAADRRSGPGE